MGNEFGFQLTSDAFWYGEREELHLHADLTSTGRDLPPAPKRPAPSVPAALNTK
jgi:hypothetical protein